MKLVVEYEVPERYKQMVLDIEAEGDSTGLREVADNIGWGEVTVVHE